MSQLVKEPASSPCEVKPELYLSLSLWGMRGKGVESRIPLSQNLQSSFRAAGSALFSILEYLSA